MNDWMICYVIPVSDAQNSYSFIKSYEGIFMSVFCILVLLLVFYIIHNNRIRNEELRHDAQTDGLTNARQRHSSTKSWSRGLMKKVLLLFWMLINSKK